MIPSLELLRQGQVISALDEQFARGVSRIAGEERPEVQLAAALVSRDVNHGHVCLDLTRIRERAVLEDETLSLQKDLQWPDLASWLEMLQSSPLVGDGEVVAPLVLDSAGRLYLRRYWQHQSKLAAAIRSRALPDTAGPDEGALREILDRLFPPSLSGGETDWQRVAALTAARRRFCVISGGPGTGKTYTVVKIVALLTSLAHRSGGRLRVTLATPTGKAAARLGESIRRAKGQLDCTEDVRRAIPEEASTIHRCLGAVRNRLSEFRHHADNPLLTDLVLVDEASMVDIALMTRLVDAIPPHARLILLGDKDQLASVEAGAVLGDICGTGLPQSPQRRDDGIAPRAGEQLSFDLGGSKRNSMRDCIVELRHSYRYDAERGIGALARAINAGDADAALSILASPEHPEVSRLDPAPRGELSEPLREDIVRGFRPYLKAESQQQRLADFDRFRVLCAHRRGYHGVEAVNAQIERLLTDRRLLRVDSAAYPGRPILITRNDYQVSLFNGDVGLLVVAEELDGETEAVFVAVDGTLRKLAPSRLPPHETVFAMSVHKSQGSEFDEVAVLLPEKVSPVVSRELLYTAVTRAKDRVTVHASAEIVREAVIRPIQRASGLRDALWSLVPGSGSSTTYSEAPIRSC
jgi:exodeoxyribonuclease V alpha subunit